jgi:hypothetical protein
MTEEEAAQRWCPFARVPATAVNRVPGGQAHPAARCLGSGCMAWRWRDTGRGEGDDGVCGLAG